MSDSDTPKTGDEEPIDEFDETNGRVEGLDGDDGGAGGRDTRDDEDEVPILKPLTDLFDGNRDSELIEEENPGETPYSEEGRP
jgi:hypothetical protein